MKWYNRKVRGNPKVLRDIIETSVGVVPYVRRIQRIRRILGRLDRPSEHRNGGHHNTQMPETQRDAVATNSIRSRHL